MVVYRRLPHPTVTVLRLVLTMPVSWYFMINLTNKYWKKQQRSLVAMIEKRNLLLRRENEHMGRIMEEENDGREDN